MFKKIKKITNVFFKSVRHFIKEKNKGLDPGGR